MSQQPKPETGGTSDGAPLLLAGLARHFAKDLEPDELNLSDVAERNAAELERGRLAAIVEGARSPIFAVDLAGHVLSWNRAAAEQYGIPAAEAVGRPVPRLAPVGDEDVLPTALRRVFAGADLPRIETRHRGAAGEVIDMALTISPIREPAGQVIGASVIAHYVSDLAQGRSDALGLHTEIRAMLDAIGDGLLLVDTDGLLLSVNRAFAEWFAFDPEPAIGRPFATALDRLRPSLAEPETLAAVVSASATEPEAERTKSEFVSLVSHELRTPLTSIKGYTDLLIEAQPPGLTEEHREVLGIVQANADRLVTLVDDLLETSHLESGRVALEREAIDLAPLIDQVAASMRPQVEAKRQTLTLDTTPGLPAVWADPQRIVQVLTNLISNANKYTPAGGRIEIAVRETGGAVRCEVADTGIGLAPDELEHLFAKFFRARNQATLATPGTGLGLTITKALVEMHGGTVSVVSAPGEGSRFGFTLPLATRAAEKPPAARPEPSRGSILLVEDDVDTARLVGHLLGRAGHTLLTAATGEEAIELASIERPALILLDLVLPDMDGLRVIERLKADPVTGAIPVIVLSIMPDEGQGRRLGAIAHLGKPIDERVLLNQVSAIVRQGSGSTVLVADDDPAVRRLVVTALAKSGYHVVEAVDGAEAVAIAARAMPSLVLALLDVRMPRMDGVEALRLLRAGAATRALPVVMMTAYPETFAHPPAVFDDLGIADLMRKPFGLDELIALVDRVASGGRGT
ncbi:MAG: response regulator [Chloroflexia bacterium]|nr:response regulator [Chloroflexia bacterium]